MLQVTSDCGAVAGVTNPPPSHHPWSMSTHEEEVYARRENYTMGGLSSVNQAAVPHGITSAGGHGYTLPSGSSLASSGLDSNCNLGGGSIGGDSTARAGALTHLFSVQMRLGANIIGHARNNMYVPVHLSRAWLQVAD